LPVEPVEKEILSFSIFQLANGLNLFYTFLKADFGKKQYGHSSGGSSP
jgi:hypothetical protein